MKGQNTGKRSRGGNSKPTRHKVHSSQPPQEKLGRLLTPEQLVGIIEHMSDGVVVLDKDWRYVYVNQKAAVVLQRQKPADLIGKHIWTEYPEGVSQPLQFAYEKAMRDQTPIVFEDHYEPWDLWFENRIYPSPDSLLILFTEITDRKRIEGLLNERQYFLQKILDTEPDTVYIYDLQERRNVYVNRHWLLTHGYTEEETQAMGDQLLDLIIHPEDRERISVYHKAWQQAVENDVQETEFRVRTKVGEWRWLHSREVPFLRDETGRVKQILGITHDVTERKGIEKALRESEKRYQLISSVASDYMFSSRLDTDGRLTLNWVTGAFESITGYTLEEYVAHGGWRSTLHPDDLVVDDRDLEKLRANQPVISELRTFTRNGGLAWVRVYAQPVLDAGSSGLIGIYGAVQDITERRQTEEALAASEAELRALFAAMNDVVLVIDRDGVYREIAPTNPGLLYRPAEELLGRTLQDVFPVEQADRFISIIRQVIGTQQTAHIEYQLEINGRAVWFDTSISPMQADKTLWMARDITDRKHTEMEIRRLFDESQKRLHQVEALHSIDLFISASMDLHTTLNVLLKHVETLLEVDAADILLFNPGLQQFRFSAGRGFHTNSVERANVRLGASYAGRAALERKTLVISEKLTAHTNQDFTTMVEKEGFAAYAGVPLVAKGQIKGVLEVYHRSAYQPDSEWLRLLETLAGQAAIAIDNAQLFDAMQQSNIELGLAYDATIEGWSRALDLRDKETEGHTRRVTEKALQLARQMGLPETELVNVRQGALLHDIGKMAVPDGILLKPGALTDQEWETMRKHPTFAYEMLSPIRYLKSGSIDIPYCHHEKWDGTGYPRGLKGEQIPLAARIFAVVDVWDALGSDRPYRKAWPQEKILKYLREEAGKQFDPQVVDAFLKLLEAS